MVKISTWCSRVAARYRSARRWSTSFRLVKRWPKLTAPESFTAISSQPIYFLTTGTDGAPCLKVVDFGISKLLNPETNAQVVTTTRSLMGSPLYMAPEQLVSAKEVDARADIWALGTVLFSVDRWSNTVHGRFATRGCCSGSSE